MAAIFFKTAAILAYKLHTLPLNLISLTDLGDIGGKKYGFEYGESKNATLKSLWSFLLPFLPQNDNKLQETRPLQ